METIYIFTMKLTPKNHYKMTDSYAGRINKNNVYSRIEMIELSGKLHIWGWMGDCIVRAKISQLIAE